MWEMLFWVHSPVDSTQNKLDGAQREKQQTTIHPTRWGPFTTPVNLISLCTNGIPFISPPLHDVELQIIYFEQPSKPTSTFTQQPTNKHHTTRTTIQQNVNSISIDKHYDGANTFVSGKFIGPKISPPVFKRTKHVNNPRQYNLG